jgi:hypothetical protein
MSERRTRLVVDIVWNGPESGATAKDEHYYQDAELADVAADWIRGSFTDRDDSPRVHVTAVDGASSDRGRDAGEALIVVRTALSQVETALERLGPDGAKMEWPPRTGGDDWTDYNKRRAARFEDPDAPAMRQALRTAIALLHSWRKTGVTQHSTCM